MYRVLWLIALVFLVQCQLTDYDEYIDKKYINVNFIACGEIQSVNTQINWTQNCSEIEYNPGDSFEILMVAEGVNYSMVEMQHAIGDTLVLNNGENQVNWPSSQVRVMNEEDNSLIFHTKVAIPNNACEGEYSLTVDLDTYSEGIIIQNLNAYTQYKFDFYVQSNDTNGVYCGAIKNAPLDSVELVIGYPNDSIYGHFVDLNKRIVYKESELIKGLSHGIDFTLVAMLKDFNNLPVLIGNAGLKHFSIIEDSTVSGTEVMGPIPMNDGSGDQQQRTFLDEVVRFAPQLDTMIFDTEYIQTLLEELDNLNVVFLRDSIAEHPFNKRGDIGSYIQSLIKSNDPYSTYEYSLENKFQLVDDDDDLFVIGSDGDFVLAKVIENNMGENNTGHVKLRVYY